MTSNRTTNLHCNVTLTGVTILIPAYSRDTVLSEGLLSASDDFKTFTVILNCSLISANYTISTLRPEILSSV